MKYLPLREFDDVTNALNFDTVDCRVTGGCDVYTTKAAGGDKKLYKDIENSLESQYASLLTFSAGLPPSQAKAAGETLNLSRASAFGSLSQISSRRTFAYLIATLNASHPDYDFSHLLRPSDFKRERSAKKVMGNIDMTLNSLRPRIASSPTSDPTSTVSSDSSDFEHWGPRMWQTINQEMSLMECNVYSYAPEDDPFSDNEEEATLWNLNYFFFNKARKRVCYLYLRGQSMLGNLTPGGAKTPTSAFSLREKRPASGSWSPSTDDLGRKRARFWLGDRAENAIVVADDDDDGVINLDSVKDIEKPTSDPEDDQRYFERLSETASASPCKDRSRERSKDGSGTRKLHIAPIIEEAT